MQPKNEKEKLPPCRPEMTSLDRILEMIALVILAGLWIMAIYGSFNLPETIPTHFNIKGEVDGYGSPLTLLISPAMVTLLIPGMLWLSRYPHIFNYIVKITPKNQLAQYRLAARFIRGMAIGMGIIFLLILWMMTTSAESGQTSSTGIIIIAILAISFIPLIIYMVISSRMSQA